MRSIVVVGAGGFGREALQWLRDQERRRKHTKILGFLDDADKLQGSEVAGLPVLGRLDWLRDDAPENVACVCAIGEPAARKRVVRRLETWHVAFYNVIHPSVLMSDSVVVGHDVIIAPGSILTVDVRIGSHVHIDTSCTVAHDAVVGDYARLNPGVAVNGSDVIGTGAYIGTGATLIQNVRVGDWAVVGAGAVVINDIPDHAVAVGVPARVIKRND